MTQPDTPPIAGLLEAAVYVDDLERAVAFYRSVLGFPVIFEDSRLVALAVPGPAVLLLCRRGASAGLAVSAHDAAGAQHLAFAIAASTLPSWEHRLADHGLSIEDRRHWPRGGVSLYFRDPDGHLLELATPGVWGNY
jgi:catechol 2,3-dioxygenase-like lactoylglutathione lyase family enzyme